MGHILVFHCYLICSACIECVCLFFYNPALFLVPSGINLEQLNQWQQCINQVFKKSIFKNVLFYFSMTYCIMIRSFERQLQFKDVI